MLSRSDVAEVPGLNEGKGFGQRHSHTGKVFRHDTVDVDVQLLTSRGENDWSQHVAETAAETGLSGTNGLFEVASKTYRDKARRAKSTMDEADYASSSDDEGGAQQQGRSGTQLIRTHSVLRYVCGLMCARMLSSHLQSPVRALQWGERLPAESMVPSVQLALFARDH